MLFVEYWRPLTLAMHRSVMPVSSQQTIYVYSEQKIIYNYKHYDKASLAVDFQEKLSKFLIVLQITLQYSEFTKDDWVMRQLRCKSYRSFTDQPDLSLPLCYMYSFCLSN